MREVVGEVKAQTTAQRLAVTSLTYDGLGRVASESSQVGTRPLRTVTSAWSLNAQGAWRRDVVRPGGAAAAEDFDGLGRLATLARPGSGGRSTTWEWLGELPTAQASSKPGSPLRRSWAFDAFGQSLSSRYTAVDVDASGNAVFAADGLAVCPQGWDATCARPVLKVSLLRDVAGRVVSHSPPTGARARVTKPARPHAWPLAGTAAAAGLTRPG